MVFSEALVHKQPGSGADRRLQGVPVWSCVCFCPADASSSRSGSSQAPQRGPVLPQPLDRRAMVTAKVPSRHEPLSPQGDAWPCLEVFLGSLGTGSLAPQEMQSFLREEGSREPCPVAETPSDLK